MGGKLGSKEESLKVIKLFKQGLKQWQIAREINRSEYFVWKIICEYNKGNIYEPAKTKDDEVLTNLIIEMYNEDYSIRQIARHINKSYGYTYSRIEKYRKEIYNSTYKGE